MGKIWLQTSDGKLIHLPIVEPDVNTPDSPVKIPASALLTGGRCLSSTIVVNLSALGLGIVTIDFTVPGRTGTCNQCGQCCSHPIEVCHLPPLNCGYVLDAKKGVHHCQHLTILAKGIGKAGGTECSVRSNILNVAKGCALTPSKASEVAHCPACSFTFTGGG